MNKVVIVDSLSMIFREFYSKKKLCNKAGWGTGACFGAVGQLLRLFVQPSWDSNYLILAWDRKPLRKYEIFPCYKAKRKKEELPPKLSVPVQLRITQQVLTAMGIKQAYCDDQESDDVCATLANYFAKKKVESIIVSTDHDLYQCLNEYASMMIHSDAGIEIFTRDKFLTHNAFAPEDYWKVQALGGCDTDKVPGMNRIGPDTAAWIVTNNKWEDIISNSDSLKFPDKRSMNAFRKNFESWDHKVMTELVRLRTDLKLKIDSPKFDKEKLKQLFLFLEFKQYLLPDNFERICEIFGRV